MVKVVTNGDLLLEKIPDPDDREPFWIADWGRFALKIPLPKTDAEFFSWRQFVFDSNEKTRLTELRKGLFWCQRAFRHSGDISESYELRAKELLRLIRLKVKDKQFD